MTDERGTGCAQLSTATILLACVLGALLVVGSVWDLPIGHAAMDQDSAFGIVMGSFGDAPSFLALVASGTLLTSSGNRQRPVLALVQAGAGLLLITTGTVLVVVLAGRYLDASPVLLATPALAMVAVATLLTARLARGAERAVMLRVGVALFLVVLAEILVVHALKLVWERPRPRFVVAHEETAFQPWFAVGNESAVALLASGVGRDELMSFPSGHTAGAATLMLLVVMARLRPSLLRHRTALFGAGASWALLVAASRIIVGAHFLSDTMVGLSITLVMVLVADRVVQRSIGPDHDPEQVLA